MEKKIETEVDLVALISAIWAHKRMLIKWSIIGLLTGAVIAFSIPNEYQSTIKMASESKNRSSSSSLAQLGGVAAMMGVNVGGSGSFGLTEAIYPEIVASSPFLDEFSSIQVTYEGEQMDLKKYLVKSQKRAWWSYVIGAPVYFFRWIFSDQSDSMDAVEDPKNPSAANRMFLTILSSKIDVQADKKTQLILLNVKMQDPHIALTVADSLYEKLSRYMVDYYTAKANNDLRNSEELLNQARINYYKADTIYAVTVDRNQNLITESARIRIDRYRQERDLAFAVYQQLSQQVEANKITLQQETPIATIIEPACVADKPIAPNKKMIIIAMTILALFAASVVVVVRKLTGKTES